MEICPTSTGVLRNVPVLRFGFCSLPRFWGGHIIVEGRISDMPYTDAPGFRMYYEEHGSGFPLLLINGLGSDHLEWLHQLPVFASHDRVVILSLIHISEPTRLRRI